MWWSGVYYKIHKKKKNNFTTSAMCKAPSTNNVRLSYLLYKVNESFIFSFFLDYIINTMYYYFNFFLPIKPNTVTRYRFFLGKISKSCRKNRHSSCGVDYYSFLNNFNKEETLTNLSIKIKNISKLHRRYINNSVYFPKFNYNFYNIYNLPDGYDKIKSLREFSTSFLLGLLKRKNTLNVGENVTSQKFLNFIDRFESGRHLRLFQVLKKRSQRYKYNFKKKFLLSIINKSYFINGLDVGPRLKFFKKHGLKKLITRLYFDLDIKGDMLTSNRPAYYHLMYLYSFCKFRYNEFSIIVRYKYTYEYFLRVLKDVDSFIRPIRFPHSYVNSLIKYFAIMCFTREVHMFSIFIKNLLEKVGRVGQKNFFHTFNGISVDTLLTVLNKHKIIGFYLRVAGKIGGYVGDRTKLFLIRYGRCSRSKRIYGYSYYQNVAFTKPGAIGINVMLSFK